MKNILEVKNLSVLMKDRFLVKNVSLSLHEGQSIALIGEKSSGKTSLLKAISGSLPITDGKVIVDEKDITEEKSILSEVNICLDPPVFFKYQSVLDNLEFLSHLKGNSSKEKIEEVLTKFSLSDKKKKKVRKLSYFEKKLMALALAFLTKPKLLLLDEPFKSLPDEKKSQLKKYILEIQKQDTAIIISSVSIEDVEDVCDFFVFMDSRQIKDVLSYEECEKLFKRPSYAFVEVKFPNYCGKLVMEEFDIKVKIYNKKILFEGDEELTAQIVKFLTKKKLDIYKAGYLNRKSEKVFAALAPYFKEVPNEENL